MVEAPTFAHIGIVVSNLAESVKNYTALFGIQDFIVYGFCPQKSFVKGKRADDFTLKIALGSFENGVKIELIEAVKDYGLFSGFNGIHHIAFATEKYEEWKRYFTDKGAKVTFEMEAEDAIRGYRRSLYVEDSELLSYTIEFTQKGKNL